MKYLEDKIVDKLKEYGIKVFNVNRDINLSYITADGMIISCGKNEIFINYYIKSEPCYAARIIIMLYEIKGIKKILIGDDFIYDKEGKYLEGEEAYKLNESIQENEIIREFIEQQTQLYLLSQADGYPC